MSATSENMPSPAPAVDSVQPAAASPRWMTRLNILRIVAAAAVTFTLLPYSWARVLVVYSQWHSFEAWFVGEVLVGLVAISLLNFHTGLRFASRRTANRIIGGVFFVWTCICLALIFLNNGNDAPAWLVFVGFFPASLWVVWASWMFFVPMGWGVRIGVLAVLIAGVWPFLQFFEVRGLTGDTRVNFALKSSVKPDELVKSSVGELKQAGFTLVANPQTDFPAFQGPRSAVLPDVKLDPQWSEHPPRELWREPIGAGWGGFAVVGGYAFTQEQRGDDECVVCRELATGKELWKHADKAPYVDPSGKDKPRYEGMGGPGPRCTPTIDDGRIYTVGCTGIFNCLDGGTGHVLWTRNIVKEFGGSVAFHGVCGSPLILGNLVIVAPTGKANASLAAYDRVTGKPVWHTGLNDAAYATPMVATVAGKEQILNYDDRGLVAHDPADGKVLWHFTPEWKNNEPICSQPIANAGAPDQILLTAGYDRGSALLKVSCGADKKWTAESLWKTNKMKTKFTTAVAHDGYVYGLDDGIMQCLDLKTGRQKWKGGRYEHGQILLAGNLILVQTEKGPVVLIKATPERLTELGTIPALSSQTWNVPALAGKYLLVRNDREAACYEVSLKN